MKRDVLLLILLVTAVGSAQENHRRIGRLITGSRQLEKIDILNRWEYLGRALKTNCVVKPTSIGGSLTMANKKRLDTPKRKKWPTRPKEPVVFMFQPTEYEVVPPE